MPYMTISKCAVMLQISTFTVSAELEADLGLRGSSGFTSDCGHTCKDGHEK